TDIATDGTLAGPNLDLMTRFATAVPGALVASGGVGTLDDLRALAHLSPGPEATIVGRALYESRFSLSEAIEAVSRPPHPNSAPNVN
ncbi:MAG: hypothetical protein C4320_04875, partial [Armatimonadota bacterium]